MKSISLLLAVIAVTVVTVRPGVCAQKKAAAKTTPPAAKAATVAMTDDIYIEVKAHEAAFLATALKDKQNLATGTMEQKVEFAKLLQKKQGEFGEIRKKLLSGYKVPEQEFKAFESKLTGEGVNRVKTGIKDIRLSNLKFEDNDGFNARAQRIANGIAQRTGELQSKQTYK